MTGDDRLGYDEKCDPGDSAHGHLRTPGPDVSEGLRRLFVAAVNYSTARNVAQFGMGLNRAEWGYLDRPDQLRGRARVRVYLHPTLWWRRPHETEALLEWLRCLDAVGKVEWVECGRPWPDPAVAR